MSQDTYDEYMENDLNDLSEFSDVPGMLDENDAQNHFPDGIGLSIEEVQALITKHNETFVAKDDPILLTVTILNAFLGENKKLQDKYNETLKTIYSEQVKDFLKNVQKNTNEVKESLETISIDGLHKVHNDQTKALSKFSTHLFYASAIMAVSALVNVAVFIWS